MDNDLEKVKTADFIDTDSSSSVEYDPKKNYGRRRDERNNRDLQNLSQEMQVVDLNGEQEYADIINLGQDIDQAKKAVIKVEPGSGSSTTYTVFGEEKVEAPCAESEVRPKDILELIRNYHIITSNKLDTLLKYYEDELLQERSKRQVLEHKLESIDKLIQNFENNSFMQ
jgi:hypothetical protein